MKKSFAGSEYGEIGQAPPTKKFKHWSLGLLNSMNDPELIVKETKDLIVIKDMYPKAKVHYLILPKEEINSIFKLNRSHIKLLEGFNQIYVELKNSHKEFTLKAGFHAIPSMQRLHMHVISTDFISHSLKTKQHWNSFNTKYFVPYLDLYTELKQKGNIEKIPPDVQKSLLSTPLQCNQCEFKPKNMPQLKEHLLLHQ